MTQGRLTGSAMLKMRLVLPALAAAAAVAAGEPEKPKPLRLGDPIVVDAQDPPANARRPFLWVAPAAFCSTKGGMVLVTFRGIKTAPVADLWAEGPDRTWKKLAELPGASWPVAFALGEDVGIVASVGEDITGGYGNTIRFFRVGGGKQQASAVVCKPPARTDRVTVSSVNVAGERVCVFLLREVRGQQTNRLLFARSTDGGKTWPEEPTAMGDTTMHEDASRAGSFQFSADDLGRFVVERDGRVLLYRTADGGRTWAAQAVRLRDDLPGEARRLPLAAVRVSGGIGLVYLGSGPRDPSRAGYYFTRSADRGGTWEQGAAITEPVKMADPAVFVKAAAAGERVAMSFVETLGRWTEGEMRCRLAASGDGGRTWRSLPLERYYNGVALFGALGADAAGDRLLFATAICLDVRSNPRNYLVVQELSARARSSWDTRPTDEQRGQIAELVAQLGSDRFAVRDAATRKLATLGAAARDQLVAATKSGDAEVRERARRILERLFPACIRLGP